MNDEYMEKIDLAMPPAPKRGVVRIAIEFDTSIYNFKGHNTNGHVIYQSPNYTIYSSSNRIKDNLFLAEDIIIDFGDKEVLLEDYAQNWITSSELTPAIFDSKEFLEQTCISHTILRIQDDNDALPPYNSFRERRHKETQDIRAALLKILEPRIQSITKSFYKKYGGRIDESEIYGQAFNFCNYIIAGEDQKIIQDISAFRDKNKKQESRQHLKEQRLHPLRPRKGSKNLNIETARQAAVQDILFLFPRVSPAIQYTLTEMLIDQGTFAYIVSQSMNQASNRVYKPWYKQNLVDFIFAGKYSLIFRLLRDHFKTQIVDSRKRISLNDEMEYNSNHSAPPRRKWKSNIPNYLPEERLKFLELAGKVLSEKLLNTYSKWLSGSYNSSDPSERKRLQRAKITIANNNLDIPKPKSRRKDIN